MLLQLILVSLLSCIEGNEKIITINGIDYTDIATEAESHKEDILDFLNKSQVKDKYKLRYHALLMKITENLHITDNTKPQIVKNDDNRRVSSTRRIVAGHNTSIEAVPWQVSIREKSYPICGGSVVTDTWIITAAHCLLRARSSDISVRLGSSWKTYGGEMYDVKECFVHPRYVSKTKINDVGLIRLYFPLRFTSKVLPIGIVGREAKLLANQSAIVSGWGKLKVQPQFNRGLYSAVFNIPQEGGPAATVLQSTKMDTIAMKLCKSSGLESKSIDPASMFCAGAFSQNSPDACQGDSGGPIVCDGVLIGVVSWGLGCARGNFPGVYARLAFPAVWDWVHGHITTKAETLKSDL